MPEQNTSDTWIDYMRKGAFEDAWKFSDNVLKSGVNRDYLTLPRHFQLIWDGTDLKNKRVLVRCYHGLGDTIKFIRYIPLLKKIASHVTVWAQGRLMELLKTAGSIDTIIQLHDGIPDALFDTDVEIMELPYIFRTTISTIPSEMPYLHVDPLPLSKSRKELSVGLVWQAGDWDQSRGVPFPLLMPLFEVDKVRIYILQDNAPEAGWRSEYGTHPGERSLLEHARIIRWLDLLITVDTMPAHLAGALNVPVWVMLQAEADWRWMEKRNDSPWYPSMKLFRQEHQGIWEPVICRIVSELKDLVAKKL